jgi:hypothetical protein
MHLIWHLIQNKCLFFEALIIIISIFIIKLFFFLRNKAHVFHICRINNMHYICIQPLPHRLSYAFDWPLPSGWITHCVREPNWLFASLSALVFYLNWCLLLLKTTFPVLAIDVSSIAIHSHYLTKRFVDIFH